MHNIIRIKMCNILTTIYNHVRIKTESEESVMTNILEKNNGLDKIASTTVRRKYTEVAKIVKSLKKPVEITVNGKADLVIMNPELFEGLMDLLEDYHDQLTVLKLETRNTKSNFISSDKLFKNVSLGEYGDMSIDELLDQ